MGFRFRKSIKIAPGVKLNVGKKGISSVSIGGKGYTKNISKRGTRTTVSLGHGVSYTDYKKNNTTHKAISKESKIERATNKITELAKNYRECDIDNKQGKIPCPKILRNEWIAIISLFILGVIVHPVMYVFALIPAIMALWTTLFNKQMKAKNQQFYAIRAFHLSNFNECIDRCNKSLKYMEYESTRHLLEEAQQEVI